MNSKNSAEWIKNTWRPLMAYQYMVTCITDFIIFPILWELLQYKIGATALIAWEPLTLKGGGLYHLSMGAVLGVSAWTRGQEKLLVESEMMRKLNNPLVSKNDNEK